MVWTERMVGTNAIGTALAEAAPVQLFSAEHYESQQHPWYCTAAPVHDPRDGELLGVVDVSGPALTLHPAISALVESAARLAEAGLWRQHQDHLDRLRRSTEAVVNAIGGPLLVVDDHGWVAHHSGVSARDRIGVPQSQLAIAVPGLGLCVPERLADGWLVRPTEIGTVVRARLDAGDQPALEVETDGSSWRTPLTRRHAAHQVTARAEVSRLRRSLGALVATHPYRLAEGVDLTVVRALP